ncbi:MAG: hypothetical protein JOZ16_02765 [Methylobacteriaceae bacterium]|nr:hypothetical protein [Methylobacteriaceae bacterium]
MSAASDDPMTAIVGRPATITVQRQAGVAAEPNAAAGGQPRRVVVSVSEFQPAQDGGPVAAVVKAQTNSGEEREIGRFGITPHTPFKAAAPSGMQRFALPLPRDVAEDGDIKLTVTLVPNRGAGTGARLRLGGAELR